MAAPTLINLPPPPSDPVTPSDMGPGTPNSTTTSLSALSTTAIKDGHKGHPHHTTHRRDSHGSNSSTNTLDAERADRISRLAGLERVSTVRQQGDSSSHLAPGVAPQSQAPPQPSGYFDQTGNPVLYGKERSTVGSASATGSAGGRTTWASGSDMMLDGDKMSEDNDGVSSVGGFSDEGNASLVGFGETANSIRGAATPSQAPPSLGAQNPMQGIEKARMIDGVTYDRDAVDTTNRPPGQGLPPAGSTDASGDRIMD